MPDDENRLPTPPEGDLPAPDPEGGTDGSPRDPEDAPLGESGERAFRRTQERLRTSEAERTRLAQERDEALARVREFEDQQRTEAERLQIRAQELEDQNSSLRRELEETRLHAEVSEAAHALNFLHEGDALRFLDRDLLEYDDATGQPRNVRALLKQVADAKPYLIKRDEGSASIPPTPRGSPPAARNKQMEAIREHINRRVPARV